MQNSKRILAELLSKELDILEKSSTHLSYSLGRARQIDLDHPLDASDLEIMDSFSSRFMRAYEVLANQVLRTALTLMDERMESKRDNLNQAEKFQFISSYEQIDKIRILRNKVAHEYLEDEWLDIYTELLSLAPLLLEDIEKARTQIEDRRLLAF